MLETWMLSGSSIDVGSGHPVAPSIGALPSTVRLTAHNNRTSYIGRRHRVTCTRHHLPIPVVTSQDDGAYKAHVRISPSTRSSLKTQMKLRWERLGFTSSSSSDALQLHRCRWFALVERGQSRVRAMKPIGNTSASPNPFVYRFLPRRLLSLRAIPTCIDERVLDQAPFVRFNVAYYTSLQTAAGTPKLHISIKPHLYSRFNAEIFMIC